MDSVHENQTAIFIQLYHGGRKSHPEVTEKMIAPSPFPFNDQYGGSLENRVHIIHEILEASRSEVGN